VERKYASCADDATGSANNVGHNTADLCWKSDNATVSLNGRASELVKDQASGAWRFKNDDGSRVERLTNAWNDDNNSEAWKVTTSDGTQYFFGRDQRSATDATALDSAWTVPVFGNHPGEPCYDADFADSHCVQGWRWNLDYVVDPRGNTMTYFYTPESNFYGRDLNQAVSSYLRGGFLARIEYGERSGQEATTEAPMRVDFATAERCLTTCATLDETTAVNWPDVPYDLICSSASSCPGVLAPAFFTRKRLTQVSTKVWNATATAYDAVESWTLSHTFPDPGDGLSNPVLWLNSIEHKGLRGGTVTLPAMVFTGIQLPNRVDEAGDLGPAMIRYRMSSIDTETGGQVAIGYDPPDCTPSSLPSAPESNTRRCMPVYWTPDGYPDPVLEYFHKHRVDYVVADADPHVGGDPEVTTDYHYLDAPAWHYDDNELVKAKYRTWSEFRGYGTVEITTGAVGEQTKARYRYFRGMDGDHLPGGASRQVQVDGIDDHDRYAGFTREQITYNGPGGGEVSASVRTPWLSPATATAADGTAARLLNTATVQTRTTAPALPGGIRHTRVGSTFDNQYGTVLQIDDQGDLATSDDDVCTSHQYARNVSLHIVNTVVRAETLSAACDQPVSRPADVVSDVRYFYDNAATFGDAPTEGLITRTETLASYTGSTPQYLDSTTAYDDHGRLVEVIDQLDRATTTTYTPALGGPTTKVIVTSPDPEGTSGPLTAHITSTDLDPALGLPTKITDANGKITQAAYDPLGRLVKVWLPGRTTAQTPNLEHEYLVRTVGGNVVTTKRLIHNGSQLVGRELFDGLLRPRQTQATTAGDEGGRVITDTRYNALGQIDAINHPYYDPNPPGTELYLSPTTVPGRTERVYDGAGRMTDEVFLKQGVEQWRTLTSYGGDRVSVDPPAGATPTTVISDARGRATAVWQYLGGAPTGAHQDTVYSYDHAGRLASVTDPAANQWSYGYDLRGRQISATDPDRGTTTFAYDSADQLTSSTDVGRGLTLAYLYDNLGRQVEMRDTSPTGPLRASWSYDTLAKGQLTSSTRHVGAAAYVSSVTGYDNGYRPLGHKVTLPATGVPAGEEAIAGTYTTNYTYTIDGQLKTIKNNTTANLGTETVTMYYDAVGMPEWMAGGLGWGAYVAGSDWSALGQPLLLDLGNTYFQHVAFDYEEGTNRLANTKLLRQNAPGYDLNASYGYDHAGNVTSIKDQPAGIAADNQCFRYDGLRRLTEAWTPGGADCQTSPSVAGLGGPAPYWSTYSYDSVGNRLTETKHATAGDTTRTYTYPTAGTARPHTVTQIAESGPGGAVLLRYQYDNAGNTTCRPSGTNPNTCPAGAQSQTLTWDTEGKLATLSAGGQTSSYVYTAEGQRLIRREAGITTVYLPGGQELRLTVATGIKTAQRYYTFAGFTVALRTGTGLGGVSTLVADHHATAEISVANTTNILTRRRHDPFGNPRGSVPPWPGDHGFLDKPKDTSGLTHIGAREYDPGLGRFISVDPIMDLSDPQQWHGYAYANNNPVTLSDPSGLDPGGGQRIDQERATAPKGTPTTADKKIDETQQAGKNLFLSTVNEDNPFCQGLPGQCATARTMVENGADPYQTWVWLICGGDNGSTACRNELGWAWNCGLAPCPELMEHSTEMLMSIAGGVEFMGGKGLTATVAAARAHLLATLHAMARAAGTAMDDLNALGLRLATAVGRGCASFTGDTHVLLADGNTKPIAELEPGDTVLATDPHTGQTKPKKITHVWVHDDTVVALTLQNGDTVTTTEDHPFWNATDQQWQQAQHLDPGDQLLTAAGTTTPVNGIHRTTTHTEPAYNLTVADIHTYYVLAGDTPVLVHNTSAWCGGTIPNESLDVIGSIKKDGVIVQSGVQGPVGPMPFINDGRNGGTILPRSTSGGDPITYREWGTIPGAGNPKPGGERIVTGSDGSIWYTPDHYQNFIRYQ
jgi:RHS repeat-associated protein